MTQSISLPAASFLDEACKELLNFPNHSLSFPRCGTATCGQHTNTCVTLPLVVFPKLGSNFYAASGWCPHTAPRSHMLQTARSSSCPLPYQGNTRAFDSIARTSESTLICPESPSLVLSLSTTRTGPPASSEASAPKSWGRCIHQPQHFPDEEAAKFKARLSAPCKRFGQGKRHLHAGLLITRLKKQRQKSSTKSSFEFTNHVC